MLRRDVEPGEVVAQNQAMFEVADTRTLVIPVAPTIFWEAGPEARARMGIADGLIRVSVGLEDLADLIADFDQALG